VSDNTDRVLTDLLRVRARLEPDGPAIQEVVGGRQITWQGLLDESLRWADAFRARGVRPDDTVLSMLPNSIDAYLNWLGVAWLGAIEVPINTAHRGRMLEYMVANSGARVLVISQRYVEQIREVASAFEGVELCIVPDSSDPVTGLPFPVMTQAEFLQGAQADHTIEGPRAEDVAVIIYTSGTTGPSKGVIVPWAELYVFADHTAPGMLEQGGAYYSPYAAYHISGKAALLNAAAYACRLVLRETFSASNFWSDIREFGCTSAMVLGTMAAILMAAPERPDDAQNPLRTVSLGPLSASLDAFKKRFGVKVSTAYGTTEIGLPLTSGWELPNTRTCGRLKPGYPGYEVRVVDELDQPLGPGEVGELIVRSAERSTMCAGYYGMPEQSAQAWRNGWFHTGDAFTYDEDGWFYFVDRMKDTIRRRGENISSFEVEACVNEHEAVAESAAVGVPSVLGEDEILVLVRLHDGAHVSPEDLIAFLEVRAPKYMVPRYLEFVIELPRTDATQRVRKVELRMRGITEQTWDREAHRGMRR
jgi:crotonobetaine/carnitine-CoA ligase